MDKLRQYKLIDTDNIPHIGVIGAGSIGSWVVLCLSKLGVSNITVWDFDLVESHNQPNQVYRESDIGKPKVQCLHDICQDMSSVKINPVYTKYDGTVCPILICGVDSMSARKEIWENVKMNYRIKRYWDCRMGGEMASIWSISPNDVDDIKTYEETLFSDGEGEDLPCGAKSIGYTNQWIGSTMAHQIKCYVMNDDYFTKLHYGWSPLLMSGKTSKGKLVNNIWK